MTLVNGIERDRTSATNKFICTNFTEDFDMDCDGLVAVVADTLATLIRELARQGIINADIS